MARLLGIDYGTVRVGIALSDPDQQLAFPKEVAPFDEAHARIEQLIIEEGAEGVVVGIPTPLMGGESSMTRHAKIFAEKLASTLRIPVYTWPELLSSREASHAPGGKKDDASAAAIVLQSFLDEKHRNNRPQE